METIESKSQSVLESGGNTSAKVFYPTRRACHVHFQVCEDKRTGVSEFARIRCSGNIQGAGRIVMYKLHNGIDAHIIYNAAIIGIALCFRINKENQVDIFDLGGRASMGLEYPAYAGNLALKRQSPEMFFEFSSMIAGFSCKILRKESVNQRFKMIADDTIIGSVKIQPSNLDLSIREKIHARKAFLLLGIAFSIWRLIPWT